MRWKQIDLSERTRLISRSSAHDEAQLRLVGFRSRQHQALDYLSDHGLRLNGR
jgi:hypothetical protein